MASVEAGMEARTQVVPMPLFFEANVGQAEAGVQFMARGQRLGAIVRSNDIALTFLEPDGSPSTATEEGRARIERRRRTFSPAGVHFRIKGGSLAHAVGFDEVPGRSNYFRGDDPARWHTNIRHYAGLKIPAVRPGIDLVFHGDGDRLEYDFVVAPGAEPGAIEVEFEGMNEMVTGAGGELLLRTRLGFVRQEPPVVYQEDGGHRRELRGRCVRKGPASVSFEVPEFDRRKPLVIDPVLSYTQVFGGSEDDFTRGLAVGSNGEIVVVGTTTSPDFPAQNAYAGGADAFVTKLSPSGAIVFSTYLGGSSFDDAGGAAVDPTGAVYVAGTTGSMDFPGCPCAVGGFVAKLDATGNLVYSNVSLPGDVRVFDLKQGPAGFLYAAGQVRAPNGWFDAFGAKLDPGNGSVTWFTRLPGDRDDFALALAVDPQGNTVLTGGTNSPGPGTNPEYDAFVARLDASGGLIYLRYIIGTAFEEGANVAVDAGGRAYALIWTASTDLPTTPGAFQPKNAGGYDTAIARLDPVGAIELLTYFGGPGGEQPGGIAVDGSGAIFFAGSTGGGLPIKDAFRPTIGGGFSDGFVAELDPTGSSLVFSSYLGSAQTENVWEMELDGSGNMIVAGTVASDFAKRQIMVAKIGIAAARIDILASTTRWRPQHDPLANPKNNYQPNTPITIDFSGPADLALTIPGTLEIQGPVGTITVNGPILKDPENGVPYRIEWKGPFTYTDPVDSQVKPLPAANYPVVVKATKGTAPNQQVIASQAYDKLSLVDVTAIRLEGTAGTQLSENPGPGGGKRIFPEASPPGTSIPDKVNVVAMIFPAVLDAPVRVFFRSFGVDDPSASALPVDDETQPSDNCLEARFGPPANCPIANDGLLFEPASDPNAQSPVNGRAGLSVPVSADQAVAGLRVATLQGANYRVAASTSSTWLDQITVPQSTSAGGLLHPGEDLVANGRATEMLTVWRTLHLELARMDPAGVTQQDIQVDSNYTDLKKSKLVDRNVDFRNMTTPDGTLDHLNKNDWKGADVNPNAAAGKDFLVAKNGRTSVTIASGDLTAVTPDPAQAYYLRDDKLDHLTSGSHQTNLLKSILKDAYIDVAEQLSNSSWDFVRNLTTNAHDAMRSGLANGTSFWNVPLLLSFEFELDSDHDPTNEAATSGRCSPNNQPVAAVFYETIHDFAETNKGCLCSTVPVSEYIEGTNAHETLHAMTLGHDGDHSGAIMCAELKNDVREPNRGKITAAQLLRLRMVLQPNGALAAAVQESCPSRPTCPTFCP